MNKLSRTLLSITIGISLVAALVGCGGGATDAEAEDAASARPTATQIAQGLLKGWADDDLFPEDFDTEAFAQCLGELAVESDLSDAGAWLIADGLSFTEDFSEDDDAAMRELDHQASACEEKFGLS